MDAKLFLNVLFVRVVLLLVNNIAPPFSGVCKRSNAQSLIVPVVESVTIALLVCWLVDDVEASDLNVVFCTIRDSTADAETTEELRKASKCECSMLSAGES